MSFDVRRFNVNRVNSSFFSLALLLAASLAFSGCESARPRNPEAAERAAESRKAFAAARDLAGYDAFKRSFRLEDAHLGYVNSMPESLFIQIRSIKRWPIDAAWWWNPLSNGTPSLSWHDFLASYGAAERIVAKHPWLSKLNHLGGKRSLELHLLGRGVGTDVNDLTTFTLPAWQHAGMGGRPTYCFLARRGNHSWVEFFFSDEDYRAFVRSSSLNDPDPQSPLDSLELSWHPRGKRGERYSQYATIAPDGGVTLHTYVMGER